MRDARASAGARSAGARCSCSSPPASRSADARPARLRHRREGGLRREDGPVRRPARAPATCTTSCSARGLRRRSARAARSEAGGRSSSSGGRRLRLPSPCRFWVSSSRRRLDECTRVGSRHAQTAERTRPTFAVVGRAKTEPLDRFVELLRERARPHADLDETDDGNVADLVINVVDEDDAEAVPAPVARHVRRRPLRAREPLAARGLPDARARAREHRALLRARRGRLVHDDGARPLRRQRRPAARRRWPTRSSSGCSRSRARGS